MTLLLILGIIGPQRSRSFHENFWWFCWLWCYPIITLLIGLAVSSEFNISFHILPGQIHKLCDIMLYNLLLECESLPLSVCKPSGISSSLMEFPKGFTFIASIPTTFSSCIVSCFAFCCIFGRPIRSLSSWNTRSVNCYSRCQWI